MNIAGIFMMALDRRAPWRWSAPAHNLAELARQCPALDGLVVLRTCERFEIYANSRDGAGVDILRALDLPANQVHIVRWGADVVRHAFRVASGLESRLIGETHVLGQVRQAAAIAIHAGTMRGELHELFAAAIQCGRRVRRETVLGRAAASYAGLAVERVIAQFSDSSRRTVAIIGTGAVAAEIGQRLRESEFDRLFIIGRHADRTARLASSLNANAASFDDLPSVLPCADAVIAATSASTPIVRECHISQLPIGSCIIDLGMPANVEASVRSAPQVTYIGLDDLAPATRPMSSIIQEAQCIIEQEIVRLLPRQELEHAA